MYRITQVVSAVRNVCYHSDFTILPLHQVQGYIRIMHSVFFPMNSNPFNSFHVYKKLFSLSTTYVE